MIKIFLSAFLALIAGAAILNPMNAPGVGLQFVARDPGRWGAAVALRIGSSGPVRGRHGFVSLVDLGEERFGAVWLDGRHYASSSGRAPAREMALMYSAFEETVITWTESSDPPRVRFGRIVE